MTEVNYKVINKLDKDCSMDELAYKAKHYQSKLMTEQHNYKLLKWKYNRCFYLSCAMIIILIIDLLWKSFVN